MRRCFAGANWKMNGSGLEGISWLESVKEAGAAPGSAELVLFPPFTLLPVLSEYAREAGVALGGQDLHPAGAGAFTGEISVSMLVEAGCTWVIVGHSERRHLIGESDDLVRRKLHAALEGGLGAVLCVGEKLEEREAGMAAGIVERQLVSALGGLGSTGPGLVIAYEPVWAIGTGRNATPEQAEEMHGLIAGILESSAPFAAGTRIIYGGSVNPGNAAMLMAMPGVHGALVGGASLDASSFLAIAGTCGEKP